MKTIEQKVADTILQEKFKVRIGDKEYNVTPICYGTLIRISGIISTLPPITADENIFSGALRYGVHAEELAEIVALCLINRKDTNVQYERKPFYRRKKIMPGLDELKAEILFNCSIAEVGSIIRAIFSKMELSDFFGVMVSLSGVNLIAETKTTASGQPSEE